ncbi:MAG: formamidopyrimidine-DNA glycosylase, partial [Planctomycetaceae bacterium]|nr:formamidopyrimidine-DNA glycosylase [Planctomycetaceae bacterium]
IRPHIMGQVIEDLVQPPCTRKPITLTPRFPTLRRRAMGRIVDRVWRRAKRIVLELDSGESFLIEPRMTGLMLVTDPPSVEHLRVEWRFTDGNRLWFWDRRGLGTIHLCSPVEREHIFGRLGVDALEISVADWTDRLLHTSRAIKVALLDQKLVAGIGNLYASEILHLSGVHPGCVAARLSKKRLALLHEMTRFVLEEAIRYEGSTLSDGTYRNVLNQDGGYQNEHRVYDREGELCPTCGERAIRRIVQAQRSTFYCPMCQRR